MARVTIEHPDLDGTTERDERSLPAWEAKGWRVVGAESAPESASGPESAPGSEPEPESRPKTRDRKTAES